MRITVTKQKVIGFVYHFMHTTHMAKTVEFQREGSVTQGALKRANAKMNLSMTSHIVSLIELFFTQRTQVLAISATVFQCDLPGFRHRLGKSVSRVSNASDVCRHLPRLKNQQWRLSGGFNDANAQQMS